MPVWVAIAAGAVTATIITRLVERASRRSGRLDIPSARSSHVVPTPRVGGVGIIAGSWITVSLAAPEPGQGVFGLMLAATGLALIGLVDDLGHISVAQKLGGQIIAAVAAAWVLQPQLHVGLLGAEMTLAGGPAAVLAVAWILLCTNAVNFMDGIDGLVASVAAIAALGAAFLVSPQAAPLFFGIAAGCIGFLVWNRPPASIFMGDTGSQYVGFLLGASLLAGGQAPNLAAGAVLLAPFLLDVIYTLVRRVMAGKSPVVAHREHLYQRLADSGIRHGLVTSLYSVAAIVCVGLALAFERGSFLGQAVVLSLLIMAFGIYAIFVRQREVRNGRNQRAPDASTVADGHQHE